MEREVITEYIPEEELRIGDALYLRFAGESRQIARFEKYDGPFEFVSRIARFSDGTGISLLKGHYYYKAIF